MGTGFVVRSQIKNYTKIGEKQLSVSNDFYAALDKKVVRLIEEACARAAANNSNPLMSRDI